MRRLFTTRWLIPPGMITSALVAAAPSAPRLLALGLASLGLISLAGAAMPAAQLAPPAEDPRGCLHSGDGFLRAKIRGAINLDINWHNAELQCEGGLRPNSTGVRVSFAGPKTSDGRRLRMVFGVGTATEGREARALPTNLTVIFEGEKRLFATRGEDRCTIDSLTQERVGRLGGPVRTYRVVAHGFCTGPASSLDGASRILVSSFDFAGRVSFEDSPQASAALSRSRPSGRGVQPTPRQRLWLARNARAKSMHCAFF